MNKFYFFIGLMMIVVIATGSIYFYKNQPRKPNPQSNQETPINQNPLSIKMMRQKAYPGSELIIEETLADGSNYHQYVASYQSDGLKIYGLLTVPKRDPSSRPVGGTQDDNQKYPVIVFNHGYIPPEQYQTTERYVTYVDAFARSGYIVFKPDYRGHGNSEGQPEGAYYSPAYTIDVLNAVASLKKFPQANPEKIGMWGHSLGGNLTLRAMVTTQNVQVGVIWAGVVGTYEELMTQWHTRRSWQPSARETEGHVISIRQNLLEKYGSPQQNPTFWQSIDPRFYLTDISGPVQLHQGLADEEVPPVFSESLNNDLKKAGKTVEHYTYPEGDHNLSTPNFEIAMQRSIEFFNKYLKGFFGGMKYQQSKQPAFRQRMGQGQGQTGGNRQGFRPVQGEILSTDEKSITVKMPDGSSKIVLVSDKTTINKASEATKDDLKTGEKVAVFGQQNADGSVTAQNIQLNPILRGQSVPGSSPAPTF